MRIHGLNNHEKTKKSNFSPRGKKRFLIIAIIAVAIIVLVIGLNNLIINTFFNKSFLETRDLINIGLRLDVPPFGQTDESGSVVGFDKDVIDSILVELLGDSPKLYEYSAVNSQDAGASIKYAKNQIVLGMLISGTEKTKGFLLTKPYFYDDVVVVTSADSKVESLKNIEGNKVGILSNAISMDDFEKYMQREKLDFEIFRYTDYESAVIDLQRNRINTFVVPRAIANTLNTNIVRVLAEPIYEVGYCIMLPTAQTAVLKKMNDAIDTLQNNGGIDIIKEKWGLV